MADIPEHILRRSAEARAKKEGRPVDEILAEMKGAPEEASSSQPQAASPKEADLSQATADSPKAEASSSSPAGGGGGHELEGAVLLAAVAQARGMPESLTERSAKARAKKEGTTVDDVLAVWAAEAGISATSSQLPAAGPEAGDRQQANPDGERSRGAE